MPKLELGCGRQFTPGYIHHDITKYADHVDLAWNLDHAPWPFALLSDGTPGLAATANSIKAVVDPWDDSRDTTLLWLRRYERMGSIANHAAANVTYDGWLDEILALDVLEHLHLEPWQWLNECHRLLKPGGVLEFRVPAHDNPLSYRDTTHQKVFHEQSFVFWDPSHELHTRFGSQYFYAQHGRWWKQVAHRKENDDHRFTLRARAVQPR